MQLSRCVAVNTFVSRIKPLVVAVSATMLMCSTAYAASFGHSRIVSEPGQPLRIEVTVAQLSADDQRSLVVVPAPAAAWAQAGLRPPVDLASLQVNLKNGISPDSKVIQVSSIQPFDLPVADLLLNVLTATGQQQYQVSILTRAKPGAPGFGQDAVNKSSRASGAVGAQNAAARRASQGAIRVRRGDTMFAIARRNAVPDVTVYQMMVALQRANPQAFIHENLNLVKAGATLKVPGMAALTAISDREARRIFQEQSQAFAAYRQGLAGQKGQALQGGSAAEGKLSQAEPPPVQPPATPKDQVILSSGSSASDAKADDRVATSKGIAESQERVSQLEDNVKSLNKALQSQGEAAKDAFVDGAIGLSQSIADVASSVSGTSGSSQPAGQPGSSSQPNGASATAAGAESGAPVASGASGSTAAGNAAAPGSASGSGAGSSSAPAAAGSATAAASGAAAKAGEAASRSSQGNQILDPSNPAAESYAGKTAAPGADKATAGGSGDKNAAAAGSSNAKTTDAAPGQAGNVAEQISNKAEQSVSWFQEHLLGVVTGLLAFIVLVIAWLLRRANSARDYDHEHPPVTEAMVQEKLDQINLDLRQDPSDESHSTKK